MECKNAYMLGRIPYVLCRKEASPQENDRKSIFHAMCAHQAACPAQNCHKLTGSWPQCAKLRDAEPVKKAAAESAEDHAAAEYAPEAVRDAEIPAADIGAGTEAEIENAETSAPTKKGRKSKKTEE